MKRWTIMIALVLGSLNTTAALADSDGSAGFKLYNFIFGTRQDRTNAKNCGTTASVGGIIPGLELFFCVLEKVGGVTGAGNKLVKGTTQYAVVNVSGSAGSGGVSMNGISYDFQAQVWVCVVSASVTCANTTDFNRAVLLVWTNSAGINRGEILWDNGALSGTPGSALNTTYDLSSSTANRSINTKVACGSNCTWSFPDGTQGTGVKMEGDWTSSSATLQSLAAEFVIGSAAATTANVFRFMGAIDTGNLLATANYGLGSTVPGAPTTGGGVNGFDLLASGDLGTSSVTPSNTVCLTATIATDDLTFTKKSSNAGCPTAVPYSNSLTGVGNFTVTNIVTTTSGLWNGMATNPSSIPTT